MNELIAKIEQWAEERNIIKGSKPIDQAMKLFSEFGELADNVGKGRDCRDDIGDVFVVLVIICKQCDVDINSHYQGSESSWGVKTLTRCLAEFLSRLVYDLDHYKEDVDGQLIQALSHLSGIAELTGSTLQECIQIAYNDIKDRKGIMYNGVFIKESDPAYEGALDNIEADKRMTKKRIRVDIADL